MSVYVSFKYTFPILCPKIRVDETTIKVAPPNPHFKTVKLLWYVGIGVDIAVNHTSYRAFVRSTKRLLTYYTGSDDQ